jgi:hypothetical protein
MTALKLIQAWYVARIHDFKNVYSALVGKSEGNKPLGTRRVRWDNRMTMDLK